MFIYVVKSLLFFSFNTLQLFSQFIFCGSDCYGHAIMMRLTKPHDKLLLLRWMSMLTKIYVVKWHHKATMSEYFDKLMVIMRLCINIGTNDLTSPKMWTWMNKKRSDHMSVLYKILLILLYTSQTTDTETFSQSSVSALTHWRAGHFLLSYWIIHRIQCVYLLCLTSL